MHDEELRPQHKHILHRCVLLHCLGPYYDHLVSTPCSLVLHFFISAHPQLV